MSHVGPGILPFFKGVIIYFVAWLPVENPSVISAIIKCFPILWLIYFVGSQGITFEKRHDYQRRVFVGLIFSCVGDALLIWHEQHFVTAMVAFGIAHISYIRAFGFSRPFCWLKGIPFVSLYLFAMYMFYPGLQGILLPGVFIYVWILLAMGWRAVATVDILENVWSWTSLAGCMGAICFCLSDGVIGFNEFHNPVPMARPIIMASYYAAQVLIAVSAVDTDNLKVKISLAKSKQM